MGGVTETPVPVSHRHLGGVTQTPVFNTRKEPSVNHQLTTSKPPYVCTEPAKTPAPCRSRSGDKAQSAKKIRLDETTWRFEGITGEQLKRWREAYPAADVELELRRAAAWIEANPRNRKTNYARYLANWLSRAQDRAPRSALVPVDRMPAYMDVSKQDYGNQTVIPL